uniref:Uncharacterized protein n=1 Tax=[Tolypothrix] sp. PCC 7415 TaxID=373957 RepID=A0A2P0ZGA9_9CYAN|nr:hypothetical protein [[Tolypothrix] sp. PCC 7415]
MIYSLINAIALGFGKNRTPMTYHLANQYKALLSVRLTLVNQSLLLAIATQLLQSWGYLEPMTFHYTLAHEVLAHRLLAV